MNQKVTDQCVEMRRLFRRGCFVLQYRSLRICVDASGALCPNGYTKWIDVETVLDIPDTCIAQQENKP